MINGIATTACAIARSVSLSFCAIHGCEPLTLLTHSRMGLFSDESDKVRQNVTCHT